MIKTGNALIEQSASGLPPRFDKHWLKIKYPTAPAVRRGRKRIGSLTPG
jgi:hypothetical protein